MKTSPELATIFLDEIRARDFVLFEEVVVPFTPGLCAITGGSGAGKSLLTEALRFVTGARVGPSCVRRDAAQARVEASFRVPSPGDPATGSLDAILEAAGVPARFEDDDAEALDAGSAEPRATTLVLARTLPRGGRGRAFVNGASVSLATLRRIGGHLVEVAGQEAASGLRRPEAQVEILDAFAGADGARMEVGRRHDEVASLQRRHTELAERAGHDALEHDRLRERLDEIVAVAPEVGELERLEAERRVLRQSERVLGCLARIESELYEADGALYERLGGLSREAAALAEAVGEDPGEGPDDDGATGAEGEHAERVRPFGRLSERLSGIAGEVAAVAEAARRRRERHAHDEPRLAAVEERIGALRALERRLGIGIDAAVDEQAELERRIASLREDDVELARAGEVLAAAEARLADAAATLTAARERAAPRLAKRVTAALAELGMEEARLRIELRSGSAADGAPSVGRAGAEDVVFLLAANPGEGEGPLAQVASGGEMARVMLAIEGEIADRRGSPLLVLDEIDQNVGARAADAVARRLGALARGRQVLLVTHLAPIAGAARHHLRVRKEGRGRTRAVVTVLADAEARRRELAAMIGGEPPSSSALREAARLIAKVRTDRQKGHRAGRRARTVRRVPQGTPRVGSSRRSSG